MEKLATNWASFVINNRVLVLILTLTTMMVSIGTIVTNPPPYNNSSEIWFLEGDPDLEAFYEMQEKFGDSEYMAVGIAARAGDKDVFEPETIKMIAMITEMLEDHEIVTQVRSLSKYQYTHNDNNLMATDDLFEDIDAIDENPQILQNARQIILGEKLAIDNLVSEDLKHTRIVARTEYVAGENDHKVKVVTDLMKFLEENAKKDGVITLPSGLQYKVLTTSNLENALTPKVNSPCTCHYAGTLIDGTEFDSSIKRGRPSTFAPNQVIRGWTEAMQLMKEGDKWELYIPSELGYGNQARGRYIKGGDVLVFTLELIKVNSGGFVKDDL